MKRLIIICAMLLVSSIEVSAEMIELTSSEKETFEYRWTLVNKGLIKRTRDFELAFDPNTSTLCFWHDATKYLRDVRNQLLEIEKSGGSEALEEHLNDFMITAAEYIKVFLYKVMISEEAESIV